MGNDNSHLHEIPISRRHFQYFDPNKLFHCSYFFHKSITCFNNKIVVRVQPRLSKGITDLFWPHSSFSYRINPYTNGLVIPFYLKNKNEKVKSSSRRTIFSFFIPLGSRSFYWINETYHYTNWKWPCTTPSLSNHVRTKFHLTISLKVLTW